MSSDSAEESEDEYIDNLHKNLTRRPIHRNRDEPPDPDGKTSSKLKGSSSQKTFKISIGTESVTIQPTELYPEIIKSDQQESSITSPGKKETEKPSKGGKVNHETSRAPGRGTLWYASSLWYALFVICFILLGVFLHHLSHSLLSSTTSPHRSLFDVDAVVSKLKKNFSTLHERNFQVLKAALGRVSNDSEPKAPAVLLLAFSEANESVFTKFSGHLVKTLSDSYISFSGQELSEMKDAKKHIDDTIRESIEQRKTNVFLITQPELINVKTMLIFHSFCDDQNAPFKRAVFILTVSCSDVDTSSKWDKIGVQCLKQCWPDAEEDSIDALITRLTPSVMILKNS